MARRCSRTQRRPRQAPQRRGPTKAAIAKPESGFPAVDERRMRKGTPSGQYASMSLKRIIRTACSTNAYGKKHIEEIVSIRHEAGRVGAKSLSPPEQGRADEAIFWQEGSVPANAQEKTLTGSGAPLERVAARIRFQLRASRQSAKSNRDGRSAASFRSNCRSTEQLS